MENINIGSLREGFTFTNDLLIDSTFLLLPKTAEVTEDLLRALKQWGFEEILADGQINRGGDIGITSLDDEENDDDASQKEKIGVNVKKAIEDIQAAAISVTGASNNAVEVTSSGANNVDKTIGLKIASGDKFLTQTSAGLSANVSIVKATSLTDATITSPTEA